jgi:hypothetical protein
MLTESNTRLLGEYVTWTFSPNNNTFAVVPACSQVSSGDLVATAGYSKRMGQIMPDNQVKVRLLCNFIHAEQQDEGGYRSQQVGGSCKGRDTMRL